MIRRSIRRKQTARRVLVPISDDHQARPPRVMNVTFEGIDTVCVQHDYAGRLMVQFLVGSDVVWEAVAPRYVNLDEGEKFMVRTRLEVNQT